MFLPFFYSLILFFSLPKLFYSLPKLTFYISLIINLIDSGLAFDRPMKNCFFNFCLSKDYKN